MPYKPTVIAIGFRLQYARQLQKRGAELPSLAHISLQSSLPGDLETRQYRNGVTQDDMC